MADTRTYKILIVVATASLTLAIHYGWVWEPIFGHSTWIHAIHSRLCYVPIILAATWFGLRGGLISAAGISILVLPYIFGHNLGASSFAEEMVELFFYFAIGILVGALVDREILARKKNEAIRMQLERSQRLSLVGQIAAGVAHEIKNPLASIKGAFEIISDGSASPEDKEEFKGIIGKEIKRVDRTVKEFLDFARPPETKLVRLNFSDTVNGTLRQLEAHATGKNLKIQKQMEPDIFVNGDGEKLHQAVLNLVLNAMDASETDSSIEISLSRKQDRTAELAVRDHGEGIAPSELKNIFEPFYTTKSSGTGLGLAVVKSIVEHHNGTIDIESKPGAGTTIRISLPALKE